MYVPYRSDPIRPALIMLVIVGALVLIIPGAGLKLITGAFLTGPAAWAILQRLRKGRGLTVDPAAQTITLQHGLTGHSVSVALSAIQGWRVNDRDQLNLAYFIMRASDPGEDPRPPRLKLFVSAALDDPMPLAAALPSVQALEVRQLAELVTMRRVRRVLLWSAAILLGIPGLIMFVIRVLGGALGLFKLN